MNDAAADEIAATRGAGLLHHRHDPLDRSRRADGADGARVPPRRRRQPVHPEHPRSRDHADHADRRSRRPRSHGRPLQVASRAPERDVADVDLLGPLRRARQQPRRDGHDAQADAERARTPTSTGTRRCCTTCTSRSRSCTTTRSATARTTRGSIRSLTNEWQMIGWNNVQEMTRYGMPGVFAHGDVRHVVAGLPDVHGRDAQRHQPPVRDVRQRRHRRDAGAHARRRRDAAHLVPAEPAAAAREVVAAQQQQLRADRPARLAQLHREQPAPASSATSTRRASARS